jgi:hypothetical protein
MNDKSSGCLDFARHDRSEAIFPIHLLSHLSSLIFRVSSSIFHVSSSTKMYYLRDRRGSPLIAKKPARSGLWSFLDQATTGGPRAQETAAGYPVRTSPKLRRDRRLFLGKFQLEVFLHEMVTLCFTGEKRIRSLLVIGFGGIVSLCRSRARSGYGAGMGRNSRRRISRASHQGLSG